MGTHRWNYVNGKGRRLINYQYIKGKNINTKSSTEAELIGADNAMPHMLWTRYFLEAKGYVIDENVLYQDNMSAMLLENSRKKSITKNTKHANVRYYFIKDRVETGDVVIEHCPTEKMLGDHFTKPLQGALFRKLREEIMNITDDLDMGGMGMDGKGLKKGITCKLHNETDPRCPQECVGDCGKTGLKNGAMERSNIGVRRGTYDAVKLEKGEKSRAVRSYAGITREYVQTPLEQNRLIIP